MTIKELQELLDSIKGNGAIARARRSAIIAEINRLIIAGGA